MSPRMLLWLAGSLLYISVENYKDPGTMFSHLCGAIVIGASLNKTEMRVGL